MHIPHLLQQRFHAALSGLSSDPQRLAAMVRSTSNPELGDYQANCAMPLAKQLGGRNPADVAAEIVQQLDVADCCGPPEIVRGFINLRLSESFLTRSLEQMLADERCWWRVRGHFRRPHRFRYR